MYRYVEGLAVDVLSHVISPDFLRTSALQSQVSSLVLNVGIVTFAPPHIGQILKPLSHAPL